MAEAGFPVTEPAIQPRRVCFLSPPLLSVLPLRAHSPAPLPCPHTSQIPPRSNARRSDLMMSCGA